MRTRQSAMGSFGWARFWPAIVQSLVLVVGLPLGGWALPLSPGDVLVGMGSSASPAGGGQVRHFGPDGTLLETLLVPGDRSEETGMCLDRAPTLYTTNFDANSMSTFDGTGALSQASFGTGFNWHPNSCVVDGAGQIYVGQSDKDDNTGGGGVLKFDAAGTLLATYSPAPDLRGTDWVDLAADQRTLVYTSAGASIKQFDVGDNAQLPDFCSACDDGAGGATQGTLFAVRVLPDGGVLVADWNSGSGVVRRYDSAARQVQAYAAANAFGSVCGVSGTAPCFFPWALALDPDLKSFWVADYLSGEIFKFALDDGTVVSRFVAWDCLGLDSPCTVTGLGIVSEPTAAASGPITVTASITAADKTYDGTTSATITGCTLSGVVGADAVSCTGSGGAFASAAAGTGKPVMATVSLTGADSGKYTLVASVAATMASITPAPASVVPNPAHKIYGTADPVLTGSLSGFLSADGVTATYGRTPGENVAGSPYTISATLSPVGVLGNYAITYNTADFTISAATPVITWTNPADITYPTPLSATQLNATANVAGTFAYTPTGGTILNAGAGQTLKADFTPADAINYATASRTVLINMLPGSQTISVTQHAPATATYGASFNVAATGGGSGQPVLLTASGACAGSGAGLASMTMTSGTGSCTVTYNQAGNANYTAAPQVTETTSAARASQLIAFDALPNVKMSQSPVTVSALASSGLTVTFTTATPAVCAAGGTNGTTITLLAGGTCTVVAHQPGDSNYLAAVDVAQSFTVGSGKVAQTAQTITFAPLPDRTMVQSPFTVNATASSGLAVTFTTATSAVCTSGGPNGTTISLKAPGTCTVQADQGGNATYSPAPSVSQSFAVTKVDQTIAFSPLADRRLAQSPFTVSATASSGLAVSFTTTTPAVCTSSGKNGATIKLVAVGTCTVQAGQPGNTTYNPAPSVLQRFSVTP